MSRTPREDPLLGVLDVLVTLLGIVGAVWLLVQLLVWLARSVGGLL